MRYLLIAFGLISSSAALVAEERIEPVNERETQSFLSTLQNEIQKQQNLVNSIKQQIERKDVIIPQVINTQFENAYTMLNVKKTLYANFVNTPSIKSPAVQKKLLQIFQKDMITSSDLSELEILVKQERAKYVRPETAPATTPSATTPVSPIPEQQPRLVPSAPSRPL